MLPDFSAGFFLAVMQVVLADLVLAGDNAVVIALAARNLPKEQRRKAVFWGATAAIVLRTVLTILAVLLLHQDLPGVQLVGGALLLWIAWRLAVEEDNDLEGIDRSTTLRGAIYTILVADVVMSIDNVLAVAAIARNDIWLVVFGLLLSIPLIMGGASILLKVIDRFPIIIWVGAALIAYVGMELMFIDPLAHDTVHGVLTQKWMERAVAVAFAVVFTCIAWYIRTHDNDASPPATLAERSDGPLPVPSEDASEDEASADAPAHAAGDAKHG